MSLTLDTTQSGPLSNSYCDVAFADDYWTNHFDQTTATTWLNLDDTQKKQLLIMACRVIEGIRFTYKRPARSYFRARWNKWSHQVINSAQINIEPLKVNILQKLQFPRNLDLNPNTGAWYIPDEVKMAQCEQAAYLMDVDTTALSNRLQGVVNDTLAVGRSQIHMSQEYIAGGTLFAPMAIELLRPFFLSSSGTWRR